MYFEPKKEEEDDPLIAAVEPPPCRPAPSQPPKPFDTVLALEKHREWAVGGPRAPANLPERSQNDLEKNILESRSVNIVDFDVFLTCCVVFYSLAIFHQNNVFSEPK